MLTGFLVALRAARIPVSLREYLTLVEGLERGLGEMSAETFYHLSRTALVKDERHFDRFDQVFATVFKGLGGPAGTDGPGVVGLPEEWLRKRAETMLSEEERSAIERLGWEKLWETLRQRLAEQQGRHQGGSKWIGTAGTSPFGAYGSNPEGMRIGQEGSRNHRAIKVWDQRQFRDLDDRSELGGRTMKLALRRLRRFARTGAADELDLDSTIRTTAHRGYLDVQMRPERRNAVKVLLFLDIGGSMDWHVVHVEELFRAARDAFKHLEHFYFHNCLYERVWRQNRRRAETELATDALIRTFASDYRVVIVGDAAMSPYEITHPGGSVEHWNAESGATWLRRLTAHFPKMAWINPVPEEHWGFTQSNVMIRQMIEGRMYPLTLAGLDDAMRALAR